MTKANLKHIASVLIAEAENLTYDNECCEGDEVYDAIGQKLATNFGCELIALSMRPIKHDKFSPEYVEKLQIMLQAMSDFLAKEIETRSKWLNIGDLVWDVIEY